MRSSILLATLAVLCSLVAHAQTCNIPFPDTSGYAYLGTYIVTQPFVSPTVPKPPRHGRKGGLGGDQNCQVEVKICVWQKDNASIHIYQDLNTFKVTGSDSCFLLDTMSTSTIIGILAEDAVEKGVSLTTLPCTSNCLSKDSVTVWQSTCAIRTGAGKNTQLIPCPGTGICFRRYAYCCPRAALDPSVMIEIPAPLITCPTGCQPTCKSGLIIRKPKGKPSPKPRPHRK